MAFCRMAMPLFSFHQVSKFFGSQIVLEKVSWGIDPGHHVGLIGSNGAGKTTLMKLITGELAPDEGTVTRQSDGVIGYLTQDPRLNPENTVIEETLGAFSRIHELERELRHVERALEETPGDTEKSERLLTRYGKLQDEYERAGGYAYHHRADAVLHGLGFSDKDMALRVNALSGGQKTRLGLARLLLGDADMLLLDEPESHLDMAATEWLEQFVRSYPGAVLLISHDRYFLDRTVTEILELDRRTVELYPGNYSRYVALREERLKTQTREYEKQQDMIARTEEFIRRNIAGQKTKQAQGRRKQLERLERLDRPQSGRQSAGLTFSSMTRSGDDVLIFDSVAKGYGGRMLFTDLSFVLRRSERVGVVGPNGCGKTTLLRLITGSESPDDGVARVGASVRIGYYDQERARLSSERSVLNELWSVKPSMTEETARNILGRFLFSGDDAFKLVGNLSGGEQGRLALAKIMLEEPNLLILDEPTNHLDILSRHALEKALNDYPGTLLVVSHDRYFLDQVVDELLVFEPEGLSRWPGDYSSYRVYKEEQEVALSLPAEQPVASSKPSRGKPAPVDPNATWKKQRKKAVDTLETAIQRKEADIARFEEELNDERVFTSPERLGEVSRAYAQARQDLEKLYLEWEILTMELEQS